MDISIQLTLLKMKLVLYEQTDGFRIIFQVGKMNVKKINDIQVFDWFKLYENFVSAQEKLENH